MKKIRLAAALIAFVLGVTTVSAPASATVIQGSINRPAKIASVSAGTCTVHSINLHWTPVQGASGYQIVRATARNGQYTLLKETGAGSQAFMNTSVAVGKEYFYKVRAFNNTSKGKVYGKYSKILRTNTKMLLPKKVTAKYNVNVRKYAGTDYAVAFGLPKGQKASVLCESSDKNGVKWYRIQFKTGGKKYKGYVRADLVS